MGLGYPCLPVLCPCRPCGGVMTPTAVRLGWGDSQHSDITTLWDAHHPPPHPMGYAPSHTH